MSEFKYMLGHSTEGDWGCDEFGLFVFDNADAALQYLAEYRGGEFTPERQIFLTVVAEVEQHHKLYGQVLRDIDTNEPLPYHEYREKLDMTVVEGLDILFPSDIEAAACLDVIGDHRVDDAYSPIDVAYQVISHRPINWDEDVVPLRS